MINQEYLPYWIEITEKIEALEQQLKLTINTYLITKDIDLLINIQQDITEILKIKPLQTEYYNKIFTI